jgi:integrase
MGGASRRGTLKTKNQEVAKARLSIWLNRARAKWAGAASFERATGALVTVGDWLDEWARRQEARPRLKERTKEDARKLVRLLLREEWAKYDVRRVPAGAMDRWWRAFCARLGPVSVNARLRVVKAAMKLAVEEGAVALSPVARLERMPIIHKVIDLPSFEELKLVIQSIRDQDKVFSRESGDMVEFAAYSGLRPKELVSVQCADIRRDYIIVRGDATGTKSRREREVPIVAALEALVAARDWRGRGGPVFSMQSPREALRRACKRLKLAHLSPYDLRHFFVTSCIESGVDVPTVALWVGHVDGGALLMRTYSHIRRRHSMDQARRVQF